MEFLIAMSLSLLLAMMLINYFLLAEKIVFQARESHGLSQRGIFVVKFIESLFDKAGFIGCPAWSSVLSQKSISIIHDNISDKICFSFVDQLTKILSLGDKTVVTGLTEIKSSDTVLISDCDQAIISHIDHKSVKQNQTELSLNSSNNMRFSSALFVGLLQQYCLEIKKETYDPNHHALYLSVNEKPKELLVTGVSSLKVHDKQNDYQIDFDLEKDWPIQSRSVERWTFHINKDLP